MAELTALAWHFRTQKPALAKSEPSHRGLPSPPPSFSPRPQPGLPNAAWLPEGSRDKNPLAVWARPPRQHVGGPRSESAPRLAKAGCLVRCKSSTLEGGKEAAGRARTDQRFWGGGDESRSVCWADLEWCLWDRGQVTSCLWASIPWYRRWSNASSPELFVPSAGTLRA